MEERKGYKGKKTAQASTKKANFGKGTSLFSHKVLAFSLSLSLSLSLCFHEEDKDKKGRGPRRGHSRGFGAGREKKQRGKGAWNAAAAEKKETPCSLPSSPRFLSLFRPFFGQSRSSYTNKTVPGFVMLPLKASKERKRRLERAQTNVLLQLRQPPE